jgi:hypothetical protein
MWTTRDGDTLLIKDMATSHIINCLKMIKRQSEEGIEIITGEVTSCDEGYWGEVEELSGDEVINCYAEVIHEFKQELSNRGIDQDIL